MSVSNDLSAQPCGCDAGAKWVCERHAGAQESISHRIMTVTAALPQVASVRKDIPIATGVLDYFPLALAEVARVSKAGNDQHNPGQPLHWAREKSTDHADCLVRHFLDRGTRDSDGQRHTAKVAWRALALLQTELEQDQ